MTLRQSEDETGWLQQAGRLCISNLWLRPCFSHFCSVTVNMDFSRLHMYTPPQCVPENTGYTYALRWACVRVLSLCPCHLSNATELRGAMGLTTRCYILKEKISVNFMALHSYRTDLAAVRLFVWPFLDDLWWHSAWVTASDPPRQLWSQSPCLCPARGCVVPLAGWALQR